MAVTFLAYADIDLPSSSDEFYVYDETNSISDETKDYIININRKLEEETGSQVVVAMVNSLDGLEIEDYALKLFRQWGIGDKDKNNGVLLIISKNERKVKIEVGYGLEGALPDGKVGGILDNYIIPSLKNDDYDSGVYMGFSALVNVICGEYEIGIEELHVIESKDGISTTVAFPALPIFILIVIVILVLNSKTRRYEGYRGYGWFGRFGGPGGFGGSSHKSSPFNSGGSSFPRSGGGFRGGGGSSGGGGASRGF